MDKKSKKQQPKSNGAEVPRQDSGVTFTRAADFKSVYINYARLNSNPFEIAILFGEAGVIPEQQDKVAVEMKARISMSVVEAKLLLQMLTTVINGYEIKYGKVSIPKDVQIPTVDATQ